MAPQPSAQSKDRQGAADHTSTLDLAAVTAAGMVECVLLALLLRQLIGYAVFGVFHLCVTLGLVALLAQRRKMQPRDDGTTGQSGGDTTLLALATLGTFCVGPLGAMGALSMSLLAPAGRNATGLLAAWYKRISNSVETDPVTQLCDMVAIGRSVDLHGPLPARFSAVMSHGNLVEKQALLGLIARSFDVEYLPALKIALKSPEPVIRVQAAAVATKVQQALHLRVKSWAERAQEEIGPITALGGVVELRACLDSGLIEAGDSVIAGRTLAILETITHETSREPGFKFQLLRARNNSQQLPATVAYETLLVREGRFKELRNWRRLQRTGHSRLYRLRQLESQHRRRRPARPLEAAA
jgi:hypothetical protein